MVAVRGSPPGRLHDTSHDTGMTCIIQVKGGYTGGVLGRTYDNQVCSAARALEVVGERWSLLIIRDALFAGSTRFNEWLRLGIATNILKGRSTALSRSDHGTRRLLA